MGWIASTGRLRGAVAGSLWALAAFSCASSNSTVRSDYDEGVRFSEYRTFAIAQDSGALNMLAFDGYDLAAASEILAPDLQQMARAAIVQALEKKDLRLMETLEEADLIVTYFVNLGAQPEVVAPDHRADGGSDEAELGRSLVARGTLVVDVLDPRMGPSDRSFLVWRGWSKKAVDLERGSTPRGARLTEALQRILARYPR